MAESLATAYFRLQVNYKFQTANYALYIFDHFITFGDEVEKIWSQPLTLASLLFYLNRYMTHVQFIILQPFTKLTGRSPYVFPSFYFMRPTDIAARCVNAMFYSRERLHCAWLSSLNASHPYCTAPAATYGILSGNTVTLILRVYALYLSNKYVLAFILTLLTGQIIFMAYALTFGIRVPLPPGWPGCVLTGSGPWFGGFWAAPIVTDTFIFFLTLWRTVRYQKRHGRMNYMQIIMRDGILYFGVIFSVNMMNCVIFFAAPTDLKAIGASFSQIMTAVMISRLHLNLRRGSSSNETTIYPAMQFASRTGTQSLSTTRQHLISTNSTVKGDATFFSVGQLGGDMEGTFFEDEPAQTNASVELSNLHKLP
ncbi:hypothetical protein B0H11DRAFT_2232510 [Mycena galericulata]|nr:hypothetical protein B0H11DRAFT_2232510 [Mycena galericulata]